MKQTVHIVLVMLLAAVLVSCTNSRQTFRIGVSQCAPGEWRDKINNEMLAAQAMVKTLQRVFPKAVLKVGNHHVMKCREEDFGSDEDEEPEV